MSAMRDEIRAILREELAALLSEQHAAATETVRIESSEDLTDFARHLLAQATEPGFAERVQSGALRFALDRPAPAVVAPAIPAAPRLVGGGARPKAPVLDKTLITEADLAAFGPGVLQVPHRARLTPLAKDEARRKGLRIERIEP